jgi:hypothetical protein
MSAPSRIAAFAALLAAVFGVALLGGKVIDPKGDAEAADSPPAGSAMEDMAGGDGHGAEKQPRGTDRPPGLAVADGSWTVPLRFAAPGAYRVFADFTPQGGEKTTLGTDVLVDRDAAYTAMPAPTTRARVDGYDVAISGTPHPGEPAKLTFTVTRDGRPVTDLQPYLEARGHLVALRADDLAYLHVHPEDEATPGDRIAFMSELPTTGRYRLFLQFKHEDRVHTVAFTQEVK